ncbi:hypothetical protein [Pollutibacter soli]|uniref:hypothetical protein n=1 Tax=Pollutibacter soli TaxID=3034157 RepID=UPI003013A906
MRFNLACTGLLLACTICSYIAKAQNASADTSVKIDLLRGSPSPSSVLLNMSPSDIEKPTDITAFMFSVRTATNTFTAIPSNYAIELAPFQLLNKTRPLDSRTLVENRENFRRTFAVSLGIKQVSSNDSIPNSVGKTQFGFGIGFAIKRGEIDAESKQAFNNIWQMQQALNNNYADIKKVIVDRDPEYMALTLAMTEVEKRKSGLSVSEFGELMRPLFLKRQERMQQIINAVNSGQIDTASAKSAYLIMAVDSIKKGIAAEVKKIRMERTGFNLDFNAGGVVDFLDSRFNNSYFFKSGAWLTGGYHMPEKNLAALFIVRYLYTPKTSPYNPEHSLTEMHNLDFGGRFVVTAMQRKLMVSGEGIYRAVLNESGAGSWRLMVNAAYDIGINQKLTFSFGRNFDGTTYKGGNVIGAINLIFGLGNQLIGGGRSAKS